MLAEERRQLMLELVGKNAAVSVSDLAVRFNTSESTIRRDLERLDAAGLLVKVHGGAASVNHALDSSSLMTHELGMQEKRSLNASEKTVLAAWAAKQIKADDFVYLDAGTTTQAIAGALEGEALKATFVTNSVPTALELASRGCHTLVLGGDLKGVTEALVGPDTLANIARYNFTKSFIGTNGVSVAQGFTTPDPAEATIKNLAIERSLDCFVLADSSKFNVVSPVTFAEIDDAILVTVGPVTSGFEDLPNLVEVSL